MSRPQWPGLFHVSIQEAGTHHFKEEKLEISDSEFQIYLTEKPTLMYRQPLKCYLPAMLFKKRRICQYLRTMNCFISVEITKLKQLLKCNSGFYFSSLFSYLNHEGLDTDTNSSKWIHCSRAFQRGWTRYVLLTLFLLSPLIVLYPQPSSLVCSLSQRRKLDQLLLSNLYFCQADSETVKDDLPFPLNSLV